MSAVGHIACDAGIARSAPAGPACRRPRMLLAATLLASCLALIDGSVVSVGLPAIGRDLHAPAEGLQWLVNGYLLPLSALILLGGGAGDRFGRRRLLIGGIMGFAAASLACALATNLAVLIAMRAIQGAAAAVLLPNSLAILGGAFAGPAKARAIGVWAAGGAMASALGPVLGGWLIDEVGWRSIFLLSLPVAVVAAGLAWASVQDRPREASQPLDWGGALLAAAGLGALTWGLTVGSGPRGWTWPAAVSVGAGVALLAAFLEIERRQGARAMMPLALFGSRAFIALTLLTLLLYGAFAGFLVLVPYVLIQGSGYTGTGAGAALLPLPLTLAAVSPAIGSMVGKIGPRPLLIVSPMVVGAGFLLGLRIGACSSYWTIVAPAVLVMALGMAGTATPLTTAVLGAVDARHTGAASGLNSAAARAGGLIATALVGSVFSAPPADLFARFHVVTLACAAVAGAAGLCGLLVRTRREDPSLP